MVEFKSLKKETSSEIVVNRSKFICYICPVKHEPEAIDYINKIRNIHKTATHNVYAYKLLEYNKKRYSDDGEPHKTAGLPVLETIEKNNLTNIVAVVTRYFGGTLLGTGGLVRAYSGALLETLKKSEILTFKSCSVYQVVCDYKVYGKISAAIAENFGVIDKIDFLEKVNIDFHIEKINDKKLKKALMEVTAGEVALTFLKCEFLPV